MRNCPAAPPKHTCNPPPKRKTSSSASNNEIYCCHLHNAWHLQLQQCCRPSGPNLTILMKLLGLKHTLHSSRCCHTSVDQHRQWKHVSTVRFYRLLPGHHCESASLFPTLTLSFYYSLFSSLLSSTLSAQAGSKNSSELNSHNNMRLSGDRRSTVCAGQHTSSTSREPGLRTARKHCDRGVRAGICLCLVN